VTATVAGPGGAEIRPVFGLGKRGPGG